MVNAQVSQSASPHVSTDHSCDDFLTVSKGFITNRPSHLRLLLDNNSLEIQEVQRSPPLACQEAIGPAYLLDTARVHLQRLIPSSVVVNELAEKAPDWVTILDSLFPLPSVAKSCAEIVASYGEMERPDINPIRLASWLLTIAYIAEDLPQEATHYDGRERRNGLSKRISDTVETTVQFDWFDPRTLNLYAVYQAVRTLIALPALTGNVNLTITSVD